MNIESNKQSFPAGSNESMRIVYGYDAVLPTTGADSEQVMNTVASVARTGVELELLSIQPKKAEKRKSADELKEHYGVEGDFQIDQLGQSFGVSRTWEKIAHAWRVTKDDRTGGDAILHTRHLSVAAAALARGRKLLYETYRPWPAQYAAMRPLCRKLLNHPNCIGAIMHSQYAADSFIEAGVPAEKVRVIHNGWDPDRFEPRLSTKEARTILNMPVDRPVVTYTGRVAPSKGLDIVFEIADKCPSVDFYIVGSDGPDGPLEKAGQGIPNVHFVPWQPYAVSTQYLYASDILLIPPSLRALEQAGNTVLPMKTFQYLAAGRVILSGKTPDVVELLHDGDNAVFVPPGDADAAAKAVHKILHNPEFAEKIRDKALEDARALTWDARGRKIVDFIEERLRASSQGTGE